MSAILTSSVSVDSVTVTRDSATLRVTAHFTRDAQLALDVDEYLKPRKCGNDAVPHPGAVRSSAWEVFASTPHGAKMPNRGARGGGPGEEHVYTWMFDARHVPVEDPVVVHVCEGAITLFATYLTPPSVA